MLSTTTRRLSTRLGFRRIVRNDNTSRIRHEARSSLSTTASSNSSHAANTPYLQGDETHFGFASVKTEEKEGRVREVFENVADSYDVMNDLMSGGLHRYWKDQLLDMSAVAAMAKAVGESGRTNTDESHLNILDVAGGTGDVAFRFVEAARPYPNSTRVTVCDINPEMLRVGEARARERFGNAMLDGNGGDTSKTRAPLSFVEGNAQELQFDDNTFDLYTIAFGLRNVTGVVSSSNTTTNEG